MAGRPELVLNVAEKNDAAKELSKVMCRGYPRMREGFSKFNKVYEFDYSLFGRPCHMIMTSVSGHLLDLDFHSDYRKWSSVPPSSLFTCELHQSCPDRFSGIKKTLEREVRNCQHLVLWTDGDREGENIAFEIMQVCRAVKRNIQVHRARFSEITSQSIHTAAQRLTIVDLKASAAVDARRELDLRIGCAFTRFQTRHLQKVFPDILGEQVISYGPCQFPTLGFVVDRYKMIKAFIAETFYKIKVSHEKDNQLTEFAWKRNRLFHHTACLILYQMCLENPLARVISVQGRARSKWRPTPMDTVELEKLASRKLKISAKEAMNIAEKLYTKGFISYPRTETNIFPPSVDLNHLIQQQTQDPNWGGFASNILAGTPSPRQGKKTDNAHPPIHPTKYTSELQGNDQRLYELVVRHFLACCSKDAQGHETTLDIEISGEQVKCLLHFLVVFQQI
jgi:DNA topoisomerase-3